MTIILLHLQGLIWQSCSMAASVTTLWSLISMVVIQFLLFEKCKWWQSPQGNWKQSTSNPGRDQKNQFRKDCRLVLWDCTIQHLDYTDKFQRFSVLFFSFSEFMTFEKLHADGQRDGNSLFRKQEVAVPAFLTLICLVCNSFLKKLLQPLPSFMTLLGDEQACWCDPDECFLFIRWIHIHWGQDLAHYMPSYDRLQTWNDGNVDQDKLHDMLISSLYLKMPPFVSWWISCKSPKI